MAPWWHQFFDSHYAAILGMRSPDQLQQAADRIIRALGLAPGDQLFDQCCGTGHVSRALARRGLSVLGVDLSAEYIAEANRQRGDLPCRYVAADALEFTPPSPCDAAINWFSSFGYSDDDTTNQHMLAHAHAALKPGGGFLLETIHAEYVLAHFTPERRYRCEGNGHVFDVHVKQSIDETRGMFVSHWQFTLPDGTRLERGGESRIYLRPDLEKMLLACGFDAIHACSADGAPLTLESPRLMVTARRSMLEG